MKKKNVEPYHENVGPLLNVTIRVESDPNEKDITACFLEEQSNNLKKIGDGPF